MKLLLCDLLLGVDGMLFSVWFIIFFSSIVLVMFSVVVCVLSCRFKWLICWCSLCIIMKLLLFSSGFVCLGIVCWLWLVG